MPEEPSILDYLKSKLPWRRGQPLEIPPESQPETGEPLPETVVIHRVPHHERYAYAVVNHERVIFEPESRKVIKIIRD